MAETTTLALLTQGLGAMENPIKDTTAYKYKYEQLDQLLDIVKSALGEFGLRLMQGIEIYEDKNGNVYQILKTKATDGKSIITLDERIIPQFKDPQSAGSFETYMRRYAIKTAFGLCGEDDDGKRAKQTETLETAKANLWQAIQAYAAKVGADPYAVFNDALAMPEYQETPEAINALAARFRG